jgi:hypothetical protein
VHIFDSTPWDNPSPQDLVAFARGPRLLSERQLTIECTCKRRRVVKNERMVRRFMRALDDGQRVLLLGKDL